MSRSSFLVGLKDTHCSERIVKLRGLLKKGIYIFESNVLKITGIDKKKQEVKKLLSSAHFLIDGDNITLTTYGGCSSDIASS